MNHEYVAVVLQAPTDSVSSGAAVLPLVRPGRRHVLNGSRGVAAGGSSERAHSSLRCVFCQSGASAGLREFVGAGSARRGVAAVGGQHRSEANIDLRRNGWVVDDWRTEAGAPPVAISDQGRSVRVLRRRRWDRRPHRGQDAGRLGYVGELFRRVPFLQLQQGHHVAPAVLAQPEAETRYRARVVGVAEHAAIVAAAGAPDVKAYRHVRGDRATAGSSAVMR